MKNKFIIVLVISIAAQTFGHDMRYENIIPRTWEFKSKDKIVGTFFLYRDGKVYIETPNHNLINYPLESLSKPDQQFVLNKYAAIEKLNHNVATLKQANTNYTSPVKAGSNYKIPVLVFVLLLLGFYFLKKSEKQKLKYILPVLFFGIAFATLSFTQRILRTHSTSTAFIDSAFTPFKPNVYTRWDANYFYVESRGIPEHSMMTGITAWQQQVPVPQCYTGSNAWSIPINPVKAVVSVPVNNKHFLRGAVALAANGVAIFNPYTNTGVDAFLDGQLDKWGGHSGRADDYHYHTAPMFLEAKSGNITPIAFALDGFPVYGWKEPNGAKMLALDSNHGHMWTNGIYHYHGDTVAPYMIGRMYGKVTEDTTLQIIPQAAAKPIRPSLTPLKGAVITGFHPNGSNSYSLIYTLSGKTDSVVYSWTNGGSYTYKFYLEGQTMTSNTYNGFAQCTVPVSTKNFTALNQAIQVFPNPANDHIFIELNPSLNTHHISRINMYNYKGMEVFSRKNFCPSIDIRSLPKGVYFVKIIYLQSEITKKIVIQ